MAAGSVDVQAELQEYLNRKGINTLFIKIVEDLLLNKPDNPIKHVVAFLHKNYPDEAGTPSVTGGGPFPPSGQPTSLEFSDDSSDEEDEEDDDVGELQEIPKARPMARNRRVSVSAESGGQEKMRLAWQARGPDQGKDKSEDEEARIRQVLDKNMLFAFLDESQLKKLVYAMFQREHKTGDVIIKQGDEGDNFYMIEEGNCEVYLQKSAGEPEMKVMTCTPQDHNSFGELALMYNAPRAATVKAATNCKLWALDRLSFKVIMMETASAKNSTRSEFLRQVKIMETLSDMERRAIADALVSQQFNAGDIIIRQGDPGTGFYIVGSGSVACSRQASESSPPEELCKLAPGEYFGEIALLTDRPRQATVTASEPSEILCLSSKKFQRVMGPMSDVLKRNLAVYTVSIFVLFSHSNLHSLVFSVFSLFSLPYIIPTSNTLFSPFIFSLFF